MESRGRSVRADLARAGAILALGLSVVGALPTPGLAGRPTPRPVPERPAAEWVADLASPTQGTRTRATIALGKLDRVPPEVVDGIAALLAHESWSVRAQALMVLGNAGEDASRALASILERLHDDPNPHVRRSAAGAMRRVPARSLETRRAVAQLLASDQHYTRQQARFALVSVADEAGDVAADVARIGAHPDWKVREVAFAVLKELPAEQAVPVLEGYLRHDDDGVRQGAFGALGAFGPRATPALPTLVRLIDEYPNRYHALAVLARIGPAAEPALPVLLRLLEEPDPSGETPMRTARVLRAIGPAARVALPALRSTLAEADLSEARGRVREACVLAILELSGPDDPALRAYATRLSRAQQSWNAEVRVEAVKSLAVLGPSASPAVGALRTSLLNDREPKIRGLSADALGAIGPQARPALRDLRTAQSDRHERVRKQATAAIAEIEASLTRAEPSRRDSTSPARKPKPPAASLPTRRVPARPAPAQEPLLLEPPIAQDIAALSSAGRLGARAAVRLLERAPESVPALHAALLSQQTTVPQRSAIVLLLGELGDPRSAPVLLRARAAHPEDAALRLDVLRALGTLPPTPASFAFATRLLEDPGETAVTKRRALAHLALQRDPRGQRWADALRDDADPVMRGTALFLAAVLGDNSALDPITDLLREQPNSPIRFALLLGLAELVGPTEYERRAAPARAHADEYESGRRLALLRAGPLPERDVLVRDMLASPFPIERRTAMRDLLARDALDELAPLLERWQQVPARVRGSVAAELYRAGFRLVERDRRLAIEPLAG
jgi:HEAT repeat protein